MNKAAILPVALLGMAFAFVGGDFWRLGTEADRLKSAICKGKMLEHGIERIRRRNEAIDRISINLCEGHISFDEAIESLGNIAQSDPEWVAQLQINYSSRSGISSRSDRDVFADYLYLKIVSMLDRARFFDDESRAAAITDRLVYLENEMQLRKHPAMMP